MEKVGLVLSTSGASLPTLRTRMTTSAKLPSFSECTALHPSHLRASFPLFNLFGSLGGFVLSVIPLLSLHQGGSELSMFAWGQGIPGSPGKEFLCPKAHLNGECGFLTSQAGCCCFWDLKHWNERDTGQKLGSVQNLCVSDFEGAV